MIIRELFEKYGILTPVKVMKNKFSENLIKLLLFDCREGVPELHSRHMSFYPFLLIVKRFDPAS